MTKKELVESLKDLPDNTPIWLGVDSGEGWSPAEIEEVFVCNSIDAPLDRDSISDHETENFESFESIPKRKLEDDFVIVEHGDNDISVFGSIIVIGRRGAKKESELAKYMRENKDKLKKDSLIEKREQIRLELEKVERELKKCSM